jgi:hypothetical protein
MSNTKNSVHDTWVKETDPSANDTFESSALPSLRPNLDNGSSSGLNSASNRDIQREMGHELSLIFRDNDIHPIVIFGSAGSGKSLLIASLLRYAKRTSESELSLEPMFELIPDHEQKWRDFAALAKGSYHIRDKEFKDGQVLKADANEIPFFIPLRLKIKNGIDAKFAFLEGKGEWYTPDWSAKNPIKPFQDLLSGFLEQFNAGVTAIFVAPFNIENTVTSVSHHVTERLRESDAGLAGAITEYSRHRRALSDHDRQIYLLTKWDIYCKNISVDSFVDPDTSEVTEVIAERFPESWNHYLGMTQTGEFDTRKVTPYCAAVVDADRIVAVAAEDKPSIDLYARKVWHQIYKNATGLVLFKDLEPRPKSWLDRVAGWIRGS